LKVPAKVLYFDIETAMMKVYAYGLKVNGGYISKDMISQNSFVINWAAAWIDQEYKISGSILSDVVTPNEAKKQNDKRICTSLLKLLDEADYIIGHNSDQFDVKTVNWRFLLHGMNLPAPAKKIDTIKLARKYFRSPSNALEFLSVQLGGDHKHGLERSEWIEIVEKGTPSLLAKADKYCRGDVREGVSVFRKFATAIEANGAKLYK
jgi:DNA polymerase elongation subunit (family B)